MSDKLLTAAELAELLGFAAGTIVDWAERGSIPAFKIGGRLRFRESEVVEWLEAQRVGATAVRLPPGPKTVARTREDAGAGPILREGRANPSNGGALT